MSSNRTATTEGEQLREYSDKFLLALKPIIQVTTGSILEIELARTYLRTQSKMTFYTTYHKQMDMLLNKKPVWYWVANKSEDLLLAHPELLLGSDNERIKSIAKNWISLLTPEQKATVWQWVHGMLVIAGYDISEAMEEYAAEHEGA